MGYRYSYSDFTTRGHGVIEGGWPRKSTKSKRSKSKPKKNKNTNNHPEKIANTFENNYRQLQEVHDRAMKNKSSKSNS